MGSQFTTEYRQALIRDAHMGPCSFWVLGEGLQKAKATPTNSCSRSSSLG